MTEIILAIWIFWLSYRLGDKILLFLNIQNSERIEYFVYSIGLGLGILAFFIFSLGQLNLLYLVILLLILFLLTILFFLTKTQIPQKFLDKMIRNTDSYLYIKYLLWGILLMVGIINILGTLTPELRHDSLQYHVSVPHYYILHHQMLDIPYTIYHFYSLNMEMLYTLALLLNGAALGKLIHAGLAILTTLGIYLISRRYFQKPIPLFSATLFYSLPQVAWMSSTTFNENGWMFYGVASVMSWLTWRETRKNQWLYLTAIFCGLGMTMKLIVIAFYPFILGVATFILLLREKKWKQLYLLLFFGIILLLPTLPWLFRNYIYTLNPFFPLLSNIFSSYQDYEFAGKAFHNIRHLEPLTISLYFQKMMNAYYYIQVNGNGMLGLFSVALLLSLIYWKTLTKEIKFILCYCLSAWFIYLLIEGGLDGRFIYPTYPFMAIVSAHALWNIFNLIPHSRNFIMSCLCSVILLTFIYGKYGFFQDFQESLLPVLRKENVDHYLDEHIPLYPIYHYINRNLPEDSHILLPTGYAAFYCNRKYIANSEFDEFPQQKIIDISDSPGNILKYCNEWKITHLVVNRDWTEMPAELNNMSGFVNQYTRILNQTNRYSLLEIQSESK